MCYSALVWADYMKMLRVTGADMAWGDYLRIYGDRRQQNLPLPKAMDLAFANAPGDEAARIRGFIQQHNEAEATKLQQEIFKQRKRLADAERTLLTKTTKKATEDKRIATDKVERALAKLADLRRTKAEPQDARIYPGWYAPVMVMENGKRVIRPMRYQCRPKGKPEFYDRKYPGTYNARRDNLGGFWRELFTVSHGIVMFDAFFENVDRDGKNAILEFRPNPPQPMHVACLWSKWGEGDDELLSFAAITDEPPPEIAAAGHDRCVIPIKPENIDEWLAGGDPARMQAILDDRERPYYEHRQAA